MRLNSCGPNRLFENRVFSNKLLNRVGCTVPEKLIDLALVEVLGCRELLYFRVEVGQLTGISVDLITELLQMSADKGEVNQCGQYTTYCQESEYKVE